MWKDVLAGFLAGTTDQSNGPLGGQHVSHASDLARPLRTGWFWLVRVHAHVLEYAAFEWARRRVLLDTRLASAPRSELHYHLSFARVLSLTPFRADRQAHLRRVEGPCCSWARARREGRGFHSPGRPAEDLHDDEDAERLRLRRRRLRPAEFHAQLHVRRRARLGLGGDLLSPGGGGGAAARRQWSCRRGVEVCLSLVGRKGRGSVHSPRRGGGRSTTPGRDVLRGVWPLFRRSVRWRAWCLGGLLGSRGGAATVMGAESLTCRVDLSP